MRMPEKSNSDAYEANSSPNVSNDVLKAIYDKLQHLEIGFDEMKTRMDTQDEMDGQSSGFVYSSDPRQPSPYNPDLDLMKALMYKLEKVEDDYQRLMDRIGAIKEEVKPERPHRDPPVPSTPRKTGSSTRASQPTPSGRGRSPSTAANAAPRVHAPSPTYAQAFSSPAANAAPGVHAPSPTYTQAFSSTAANAAPVDAEQMYVRASTPLPNRRDEAMFPPSVFPLVGQTKRFWAVYVGRRPGIYWDWHFVQMSINGVSGGSQKGFGTYTAAATSYNLAALHGGVVAVDLGGNQTELRGTVPIKLPVIHSSKQ